MSRELDGRIAERNLGYVRVTAPKDAKGENGGNEILSPSEEYHKTFNYPPIGQIGFAYHAPSLTGSWEEARRLVGMLNRAGIEVIFGCFQARADSTQATFTVELRRWRDRRDEGVPGDPQTHRSRETFIVESGPDLPTTLGEAVYRGGVKLCL